MGRMQVVGLVAALTLVQACGSSSPSTPTPTPTPQPTPPPPVVLSQVNTTLQSGFFYPNTITTNQLGTLTLQINWTSAKNVMLVGIATSACDVPAFQNNACSFLVQDGQPSTVATKTLTMSKVAAGSYVVIVANLGPGNESFNYTVTLTPTP